MGIKKTEYIPVECLNIPKVLFRDPKYKGLSVDAKVLYSLLLDRMTYAAYNGWIDEKGQRYVLYPRSEMKKDLNATRYRVDLAMAELYDNDKMVVVTQPNPGKACQIYVKDITNNMIKNDSEEEQMCMMRKGKGMEHLKSVFDELTDVSDMVCQKDDYEEELRLKVSMYLELAEACIDRVAKLLKPDMEEMIQDFKNQDADLDEFDRENEGAEYDWKYPGLYVTGMLGKDFKVNHNIVEMRSTLAAMSLASDIKELSEVASVDIEGFSQHLREACEEGDHEEAAKVILVVYLLHDFPSDFIDDFAFIANDEEVLQLYMDNFVKVLEKELEDEIKAEEE